MKKLQFIAAQNMREYHAIPNWKNGDVREVPEAEAVRLLADFPLNFFEFAEPKPEPVKPVVGEKSEPLDDLADKAVVPDKRKRGR